MGEAIEGEIGLWERARSGEAGARAQLAALSETVASKELRFRGAPRADFGDLVQETVRSTLAFLAAGGEAPQDLRAFLKFRSWGILSDHRKKLRSAMHTTSSLEEHEPASVAPGPAERARVGQLQDALADCRRRLKLDQRLVLELRYDARVETETIAQRLNVHRNTINVRVFRALASLRECMTRKGYGVGDMP